MNPIIKFYDKVYKKIGIIIYHRYPHWRDKMPDKMYLQNFFAQTMGYYMDFRSPHTFNEKLCWLKLYDRKPVYTTMVDKYSVKFFIDKILGKGYTIRTIGAYDSVNEINWKKLPEKFVIKCNHGSGDVIICKDKKTINIDEVKKTMQSYLRQDYYILGREWPYKNVKRKILIEEYIEDEKTKDTWDYKFFCFNGKVKCFKIDFDRSTNHKANYYDRECRLLPMGEKVCPPDWNRNIEIPSNINQMIDIAEKIAKNIDCSFERIDLYNINGKIYFGEITFFPGGAHMEFIDSKWDKEMGDWIKLSN